MSMVPLLVSLDIPLASSAISGNYDGLVDSVSLSAYTSITTIGPCILQVMVVEYADL
jgi:hypothetical protein